jgi:hypothetical protein
MTRKSDGENAHKQPPNPLNNPALYEGLECPVSREELDRRKKNMDNPNNRTLAELIEELKEQ